VTTKVSTKGQVVLPGPLRRKLGIRTGDALLARIESGKIVLIPQRKRPHKARIVKDPITGLPVLSVGAAAPKLSSKEVREILADFP
jgi:AbrB family looped-hinge helix DNA binding protein